MAFVQKDEKSYVLSGKVRVAMRCITLRVQFSRASFSCILVWSTMSTPRIVSQHFGELAPTRDFKEVSEAC